MWVGDFNVEVFFCLFDDMGNFGCFVFDFVFYVYYVNVDCFWCLWIYF